MENTEIIILILILVALILLLRLIRVKYIPANINPPIYDRKMNNGSPNSSMNGSMNGSMNSSMNGSMNGSMNIEPDSFNQCTEVKGNCNDCINANINRAGRICKWDMEKGCIVIAWIIKSGIAQRRVYNINA